MNWQEEFNSKVKKNCGDLDLEINCSIIDILLMLVIIVLFRKRSLYLYLYILLIVQLVFIGYKLYIIVGIVKWHFNWSNSSSRGFKDVMNGCDYRSEIFVIKIIFHGSCLIFVSAFVSISAKMLILRKNRNNDNQIELERRNRRRSSTSSDSSDW